MKAYGHATKVEECVETPTKWMIQNIKSFLDKKEIEELQPWYRIYYTHLAGTEKLVCGDPDIIEELGAREEEVVDKYEFTFNRTKLYSKRQENNLINM